MAEGFGFVEGAAKRGFLEGAAKPCFSLICRKLLGKFHFQGFLFAASSRGSCNFGGLLLQQAPRKLSGTPHLQTPHLQTNCLYDDLTKRHNNYVLDAILVVMVRFS